jgi:hypothetical protein
MIPRIAGVVAILGVLLAVQGCQKGPKSGEVLDEALAAGRDAKSFPAADEDYFRDMDRDKNGVIALSPAEARGRNRRQRSFLGRPERPQRRGSGSGEDTLIVPARREREGLWAQGQP